MSWFMFLMPFSAGLSSYMIFHHIILGIGSYVYLRDLKFTRAASIFGAIAVTLCGYNFSFVRNCTLPASMAWLPFSLYFERHITTANGKSPLINMLGLAFCVSMMMHVARPEVGAPELILLGLCSISKPCLWIWTRGKEKPHFRDSIYKLASIVLGIVLALPTIVPGIEWTALSTRAKGMAQRWVFTWSANWYDFLCIVLSQPLGDLCVLDQRTNALRQMVLSRGAYIPFLSSAYLSPIVINYAILALGRPKNKLTIAALVLFIGFCLMAAGNYTPVGPLVANLAPVFTAFRYPVKLMLFPCMMLVLLAVQGMELSLNKQVSKKLLFGLSAIWTAVFFFAIALICLPQLGVIASKWRWLFAEQPNLRILREAQMMMGWSAVFAAFIGLLACLFTYLKSKEMLTSKHYATLAIVISSVCLTYSSCSYRQLAPHGFYKHKSAVAEKIEAYRKQQIGDAKSPKDAEIGQAATRMLNLYFDPLTVPKGYKDRPGATFEEDFFQYARELVLYQNGLDWKIPSSYGYEAADTAAYKAFFVDSYSVCQVTKNKPAKSVKISDRPIHRFASFTATEYANTQVYRIGEKNDLPKLDANLFELLDENRDMNYRIYRVKNPRPRFYFSNKLVYAESFQDVQKLFSTTEDVPQAAMLDNSNEMSYLLNRDFQKYKTELKQIEAARSSDTHSYNSKDSKHDTSGLELANSDSPNTENSSSENAVTHLTPDEGIKLLSDNGQKMTLMLNTQKPRLLVIADQFYPGWVAKLDGKESEILRANIINKAIIIPPGRHELKIYFKAHSLLTGVIGAIASLLLFLLAYLLLHDIPKARQHASPAVPDSSPDSPR